MWKFVEKLKPAGWKPKNTRQLMGFPIEYEWKEVSVDTAAVQDDRIMADGRPAYAWWNEIQMLRDKESMLQKKEKELLDQAFVLRLAKWAYTQNPMLAEYDLVLYVNRWKAAFAYDPTVEIVAHPEEYVRVEKGKESNASPSNQ
jgi:hypothetical protein